MAIAIMIGCTSIFAFTNDSDPDLPLPILRAQIVDLLPPTDFGINEEILVRVHFTYNTDGKIVVLKIGTKNYKIKNYLNSNLNNKRVAQPGIVGKVYYLPLRLEESK